VAAGFQPAESASPLQPRQLLEQGVADTSHLSQHLEDPFMSTVHPRFVVDENQQTTDVVLTVAEWREVEEALDELDAIRAYDEAKQGPQETVSLEAMRQALRGSSNS